MATTTQLKVECLNGDTGRKINIEKITYDLFSKAIYDTLKKQEGLTYKQLVESIFDCFKKQHLSFGGSVGWYAVTVKKDMEARGIIDVYMEKGKRLHRLK
ncbi:MAG: hypothetical protein M3Y85_01310 [Bacteroidota bacterium]|nr:hypothetical protein [Bacteroidota bacterium]